MSRETRYVGFRPNAEIFNKFRSKITERILKGEIPNNTSIGWCLEDLMRRDNEHLYTDKHVARNFSASETHWYGFRPDVSVYEEFKARLTDKINNGTLPKQVSLGWVLEDLMYRDNEGLIPK